MQRVSKRVFVSLIGVAMGVEAVLYPLALPAAIARRQADIGIYIGLALVASLFATVVWLVLLYRLWSAIQDGQARTTPGKAVGLLFIPYYNFYWLFRVVWGFSKDYNRYRDRYGLSTPRLPEGLFLAYSILLVCRAIPFAGWLMSVPTFIVAMFLVPKACDAVNALPEKVVPRVVAPPMRPEPTEAPRPTAAPPRPSAAIPLPAASAPVVEPASVPARVVAGTGAPLETSIGVAFPGEAADVLLPAGTRLPAKGTKVLRTRRDCPGGGRATVLRLAIVEGEDASRPDGGWQLGVLKVPPSRSKKAVPAGSAVEVLVEATAAGTVRVKAFLPVLDEEFEEVCPRGQRPAEAAGLRAELEQEETRLTAARAQAAASDDTKVRDLLRRIEQGGLLEAVAAAASRAAEAEDEAAAERYRRQLLLLQESVDALEDAVAESEEGQAFLNALGDLHGGRR